MDRLPLHRGLELAAGYRESLVSQGVLPSASDPISDDALGEILAREGLLVAYVSMSNQVSAVCMRADSVSLMLVNRLKTIGHQRFSVAHELCHHLHHAGANVWVCRLDANPKDEHEREANEFAAALLLPAEAVGGLFSRHMRETSDVAHAVLRVCTHYRASWQSTVYRLSDLRLISAKARACLLSKSVKALAARLGIVSDVFGADAPAKMPSEFAQLARRLRDGSVISEQKYTSMLENLDSLEECGKSLTGGRN